MDEPPASPGSSTGKGHMRRIILAVLMAMAVGTAFAAEEKKDNPLDLTRVPILDGIYSVEAPGDWHMEVSGDDLTATFAEEPDADGTLVIAAPNPAVKDIKEYTQLAAGALMRAFGNGEIVQEKRDEIDGFPAYTLWFAFKTDDVEFLGWGRTIDVDGIAIQAMTLSTAKNFVPYMQIAGPIFDSYELDADMVSENIDLLEQVGKKVLEDLEKLNSGAAQ